MSEEEETLKKLRKRIQLEGWITRGIEQLYVDEFGGKECMSDGESLGAGDSLDSLTFASD